MAQASIWLLSKSNLRSKEFLERSMFVSRLPDKSKNFSLGNIVASKPFMPQSSISIHFIDVLLLRSGNVA